MEMEKWLQRPLPCTDVFFDHSVMSIAMDYCPKSDHIHRNFIEWNPICRFHSLAALLFSLATKLLKAGNKNAKVLPLPVAAMPMTSCAV